jgi:hypothetical protein
MPTTFTELLPPTASDPHLGLTWQPGITPGTGELVIQGSRSYTRYAVAEFPTEWDGTAAKLVKFADTPGLDRDSESYEVFVGRPGSRDHDECSCKGFAYGRGKPCRHIEAVRVLVAENWLSRAEFANGEQDVSNTEAE